MHSYYDVKGERRTYSQEEWDFGSVPEPSGWVAGESENYYDARGNVTGYYDNRYTWTYSGGGSGYANADTVTQYRTFSKSYYGADGLLRVQQINRDSVDYRYSTQYGSPWGAYEEYWYDALGRRIMKRSRQESPICTDNNRCYSSIERIVWDGDNILWEVQQADSGDTKNPSGSGTTGQTGNIGYVYAGGLDTPVGIIRNGTGIILHRNWKGQFISASNTSGSAVATGVSFPGRSWAASLGHPGAVDTEDWYGTVPMGFMDKTGLIYRRNRYYDPSSEQFTQPDPIGMSGGLGIYAYVGGDPVNGGDPYGLSCPPESGNCFNLPGLTVTVHRGERGTVADANWGLGGPGPLTEPLDLCSIDREICEEMAAWKSGYRALLGQRAARYAAERAAMQQPLRISECRSARAEFAMRIVLGAGMVTAYTVGGYFIAAGAFTMAVGAGEAGLLGGASTLAYLEESGTARYLAGAVRFWDGTRVMTSAASLPGLSPNPLVNTVGWARAGGLSACDGL